MTQAIVYRGVSRETEVVVEVDTITSEFGCTTIPCIECEGTGDWDRFMPEPTGMFDACVECKGTGRIWISI